MEEAILVDLRGIIHGHPWWQSRARLVADLLTNSGFTAGNVLDAGCGWGVTTLYLEERGYQVAGLDLSQGSLEALDDGKRRLILADLTADLPKPAPLFDVVLALDVIEHLDDDVAALKNLVALLRPGGLLVISVPALPALFSSFDAVQGHRRRYTKDGLAQSLAAVGVSNPRILWWGGWMVPLLRLTRSRSSTSEERPVDVYKRHLVLPPWPLNILFRGAFFVDRFITMRGWNPTGTSLIALAQASPGALSS